MRKLENKELNRKTISAFKNAKKIPLFVLLDNIRSLNNIGAVFRSADAFLIKKIFLCGITATPPHRDIQKTALDATLSVDWEYHKHTTNLILQLKKQNVKTFAIEQSDKSISLQNFLPQKEQIYAFIFGNEIKGVAQEIINLCDGVIEIPQEGIKHSLNISSAAAICFWEFFKKINYFNSYRGKGYA